MDRKDRVEESGGIGKVVAQRQACGRIDPGELCGEGELQGASTVRMPCVIVGRLSVLGAPVKLTESSG